jgi:glutamate-ammonia-ligase adenylyltransferase
LAVLAAATIAEFERVHGRVPAANLVIMGLGRFGGGALTHASDLDIVFLFSGDHGAESDGGRPLGATLYFNRLAQRVSAALSVPTAEGALYEVDTRLRPSGAQGPLAVSLDSFARYQRESAWTWEHMALTRARPLFGPQAAQDELRTIVCAELTHPRDPAKLREDVLAMRAEMARHKPAKGPLDVKLLRGGLVDLEFVIHYLQLREGRGLSPALAEALAGLADAGLVPSSLSEAYRLMGRLLVAARLLAPEGQEPPQAARAVLARACGCPGWEELLAALASARQTVAAAWAATFEQELEID